MPRVLAELGKAHNTAEHEEDHTCAIFLGVV